MNKSKLYALAATVLGGAALFQGGCLGPFWDGLFNGGWPGDSGTQRILSIAFDILNEELFG